MHLQVVTDDAQASGTVLTKCVEDLRLSSLNTALCSADRMYVMPHILSGADLLIGRDLTDNPAKMGTSEDARGVVFHIRDPDRSKHLSLPWNHIVSAQGLLVSMQPGDVYSLTAHGEVAMCDSLEFGEMVKLSDADTLSAAARTSTSAKKQPTWLREEVRAARRRQNEDTFLVPQHDLLVPDPKTDDATVHGRRPTVGQPQAATVPMGGLSHRFATVMLATLGLLGTATGLATPSPAATAAQQYTAQSLWHFPAPAEAQAEAALVCTAT